MRSNAVKILEIIGSIVGYILLGFSQVQKTKELGNERLRLHALTPIIRFPFLSYDCSAWTMERG